MSNANSILVADDSLTIRKLVETVLGEEGYEVITATSGSECLKQAAAQKPSLILLDYILPDMQGTEVCHSLINSPDTWEIPVLMMSSNGNAIRQLYQDLNNVADYLTKPFAPSVLKAVVGHLLQKEKPAEAAAAEAPAAEAQPAMPKDFVDKVTRLLDLMENQPAPAPVAPAPVAPASAEAAASATPAETPASPVPAPRPKARRASRKKPVASAPTPAGVQRRFRLAIQKHLRSRMASIPEWESSRGANKPEDFFLSRMLAKDVLRDLSADLVKASGIPTEAQGALCCPTALVPLDQVLSYLQTSAATGELRIETGEETILACFDRGQVVVLTTDHPRNYCAGAACDFQAVPPAALSDAVQAQEEQSLPFFISLQDSGHLPAQTSLNDLLRHQGENCLVRAFKAPDAVARFFPLTRLSPLARSCKIEYSFPSLMLACYRTVDDWFTLERVVPDMDVALEPAPESSADDMSLNAEESQLLEAVGFGRTIPELAEALRRKPFEICVLLFRLIKIGLVRAGARRVRNAAAEPIVAAPVPAAAPAVEVPAPVAEVPAPAPVAEVPAPAASAAQEPVPAAESAVSAEAQSDTAQAVVAEPIVPVIEADPQAAAMEAPAAPVPGAVEPQASTATLDGAPGPSAEPQPGPFAACGVPN